MAQYGEDKRYELIDGEVFRECAKVGDLTVRLVGVGRVDGGGGAEEAVCAGVLTGGDAAAYGLFDRLVSERACDHKFAAVYFTAPISTLS
jgi:hypothetical protein